MYIINQSITNIFASKNLFEKYNIDNPSKTASEILSDKIEYKFVKAEVQSNINYYTKYIYDFMAYSLMLVIMMSLNSELKNFSLDPVQNRMKISSKSQG